MMRDTNAGIVKPGIAMALLFLALTIPALLMPGTMVTLQQSGHKYAVNQMGDQKRWHEPAIMTFAEQLPSVDLREYESATSPGYYLFLAPVARAFGYGFALHAVNLLIGLGFVLAVWWMCTHLTDGWKSALVVAPLAASSYIVGASIWLNTDPLALLLVSLAMWFLVFAKPGPKYIAIGCVFAGAAVFTRQLHIWVIAPAGLVLLAHVLPAGQAPFSKEIRAEEVWSTRATVLTGFALLIPVATLACLTALWGGLTPDNDIVRKLHHAGVNPATPALALGLFGMFGIAFVPFLLPVRSKWKSRLATTAAGVATMTALVVPTGSSPDDGRAHGLLWRIVEKTDVLTFHDRSIPLAILAGIGGCILVMLYQGARDNGRRRSFLILSLTLLGWVAAQSMNSQAWQRYFEPIVLMALAWMSALALPADDKAYPLRDRLAILRALPIALLILMQIAICIARIYVPLLSWEPPVTSGGG